jgi:hypothetical protein
MADDGNTAETWTLTLANRASVMTKYGANRLRFAVLLLFYRTHGRFPMKPAKIDDLATTYVARQFGMESLDHDGYDLTGRTRKRHPADIRAGLG